MTYRHIVNICLNKTNVLKEISMGLSKMQKAAAFVQQSAPKAGLMSSRKGQMANPLKVFIGLAITLVIVVFVIVMGIVMTSELETQVNNTDASDAAAEGTTQLSDLLGWVGLVVLVIIMVVLIGAILMIGNMT